MGYSPRGWWRIGGSGIGRPAPMTYVKLPVVKTFAWTDDAGNTHVQYHETVVVSFNDDWITLRTGGYNTLMTKTIMNGASTLFGLGFEVFTKMPKRESPGLDGPGRHRKAEDADWFVEFKGAWPFDHENISLNRKTDEMVEGDMVKPTNSHYACKKVRSNPSRSRSRNVAMAGDTGSLGGVDVEVDDQGSIILFRLVTKAAKTWWSENVSPGQMIGGRYVVEHRYADSVIEGMMADGLNVR